MPVYSIDSASKELLILCTVAIFFRLVFFYYLQLSCSFLEASLTEHGEQGSGRRGVVLIAPLRSLFCLTPTNCAAEDARSTTERSTGTVLPNIDCHSVEDDRDVI